VRQTDIDNTFWQLSGGFEALSKNVDLRLNWYGPVTAPQAGVAGFAQVQLQGNQISIVGNEEVGLKGVDGEVGFRLPAEYLKVDPSLFELRAYAGGYHFYSDDAEDNVTGVKGRLELRVNDVIASIPGSRLTAEYEVSHDDVRETRHDVGLRMRIPLSGGQSVRSLASLSHQQRRMLDGVERDTDIVTGRSKREDVEDALTGTDFDRVAYADATTDVTTASTTAGDNSLIIVNGEVQGAQTLQGNQTLMGGGSTISVRGRRSGLVLPFTAPGAAGRLTTPEDDDTDSLVIAGSNTHVSGISIVGTGGSGLGDGIELGSDKSNVYVTNVSLAQISEDGININDGNTNIWLINLVLSVLGDDGIDIDTGNTNLAVVNVNVSEANDDGIQLRTSNRGVVIVGGSVSDGGGDGVYIEDDNAVDISGLNVEGAVYGILLEGDDNIVTASNVTILSSVYGVNVQGNDNSLSVNDSTFSDSQDYHFQVIGANNELYVTNSVFNSVNGNVFDFPFTDSLQLLVSNNTFNGSIGGFMFSFTNATGDIQVGSTGNINNTGAAPTCEQTGAVSFTGEIGFTDGTVVNPATCP
ncbi:MAG: right-handed parallel beta-helix repeat-containing protein, partial [Pseudomonadota bacterium]